MVVYNTYMSINIESHSNMEFKKYNLISLLNKIEAETKNELNDFKNWEINLEIVDDERMREINSSFRDKNQSTDVLSFPLDHEYDSKLLLGDIIISWDKVKKQSIELNNSIEKEFLFLFTHGLLHLLKYNHITRKEKKMMFALQKKIMKRVEV